MPAGSILMIEDMPDWTELVQFWLLRAGITRFDSAKTGAEGLEKAAQNTPDCILLDLGLPDQSGMDVCRKLRSLPALGRVPIVLLTAHKQDRLHGLECGADYFVGKSEDPKELLATVEAAFRRRFSEDGALTRGDLTLRLARREVLWKETAVELTPKMFALLHILVERSPQPVSRGDLYRLVEGVEDPGLSRALDVMLNRLRKTLPAEVGARITAVKSFGYVFLGAVPAPVTSGLPRVTSR